MTEEVERLANVPDTKCAAYILEVKVQAAKRKERALAISRMLPLRARRRRHLIKVVSKFYRRTTLETVSVRDTTNWDVLCNFDTIRPFVREADLPKYATEVDSWTLRELNAVLANAWDKANTSARKFPQSKALPPVFTSTFSRIAERKESQWYLNNIPGSTLLSAINNHIRPIMEKSSLSDSKKSNAKTCSFNSQVIT